MRFATKSLLVSALAVSALASPVPAPKAAAVEKRNSWLNTAISMILNNLPVIDGSINDVTGIIATFSQWVADVLGERTTYNELGGGCREYTIIFARGTSEPGNVGSLVGPPLFSALQDLVGYSALTIQGVNNYGATVEGYLEGGDPSGSSNMAGLINEALSQCPNTKLIVSGYSQGAQLTHNAINMLPTSLTSRIGSVLLFGDPDDGQALNGVSGSKVLTVCHSGDTICLDEPFVLPAHLTYAENALQAARFALSVL